jgi:transposase
VQGQSVLEQIRFRHQLVKHRTQVCNRLQALAHAAGMSKRGIQTKRARAALIKANFTETQSFQRDQLFELLDDLTSRIKLIEKWLEEKAADDAKVQLLLTHKGIGLLSALAVVYTLGDVSRFPSSKEAVAYTGPGSA